MFRHILVHASEHPALAQGQAPPGLLSDREEAILAGLTVLPRRRKWLLGRWAVKRLLGELSAERGMIGGAALLDARVSILNDAAGVPFVEREGEGRLPLSLSISHRGDLALAAVALQPGVSIGADLETIEPRDPALVRQFFCEAEAADVAKAGSERAADLVVARVWSAKEALLKAMGIGLRHDTRDIVVGGEMATPLEVGEPWRGLQVRLAPALGAGLAGRSPILLWREVEAHVITVALLGAAAPGAR
jgi:4'-phosphopantetheinyl transferase